MHCEHLMKEQNGHTYSFAQKPAAVYIITLKRKKKKNNNKKHTNKQIQT